MPTRRVGWRLARRHAGGRPPPAWRWGPALASAPAIVREGGALRHVRWDGEDYLYALRGNNSRGFWRYVPATDAWEALALTPANVRGGGALAWAGGRYLYAFRGDNGDDFWAYDL